MSVILETTLGDMTIDLHTSERPRTCLNFLKLCKTKYYNFCLVHSVQRNFMVQTGDPLGTGRGGESIFCKLYGDQAKFFESEMVPKMKHVNIGTVSMVNNGQNMHGSQFFITTGEDLDYLDGVHSVFGQVVEGFDVLKKINEVICDEQNQPYKDIRITHTVVLDDPYKDPPGLEVPCLSPEPTEEQLRTDRIGVEEDLDDPDNIDLAEMNEQIKDKEAKARATILEMVGDLPTADVRPPENVLFVCKLNPVTTDDDLEIIFSRFGAIQKCEVIRDRKSGESLQYAFIEFEREEDCENAFFKMDNVLIDDRRIHVDFSQSVSKQTYLQRNGLSGGKAGRNPVSSQKDNGRQKFIVKDKTQTKSGYQMIFSDDERAPRHEAKKLKKSRRVRKSSSSEERTNRNRDDSRRRSKESRSIKIRAEERIRERSRSRSPRGRRIGDSGKHANPREGSHRRERSRDRGSDRHRSDDRSKHRRSKR